MEPYTSAEKLLTNEALADLLSAVDIFSPNELEADSMIGPCKRECGCPCNHRRP